MKPRSRRKQFRSVFLHGVASAVTLLAAGPLAAQASTGWLGDGATPGWSNTGNWTSGVPGGAIQELRFGVAFAAHPGGTNSLVANNDLVGFIGTSLSFENYAGTSGFTITGNAFALASNGGNAPRIVNDSVFLQTIQLGGVLTLDGGAVGFAEISANAGDLSLATTPVTLAGATELRVSAGVGKTVTLEGELNGSGPIVKTGAGLLVLGAANLFSGSLAIRNGTVVASSLDFAGSLGIGSDPITLGAAGGVTGTLRYGGFSTFLDRPLVVATGGIGAISVASNTNLTLGGGILGDGIFKKTGEGDITLVTASARTADAVVAQGGLILTNGSALGTGKLVLGDVTTGANDAKLMYQVTSGNTTFTNLEVSGEGTGLAKIVFNQDWWGSAGTNYLSTGDLQFTLNRRVNIQSLVPNKQISPFITGPGAGAGEISVQIDGGTAVILTSSLNTAGTIKNDFFGNVWVTGNTRFDNQNRSYINAANVNGVVPDYATVMIDAGSTFRTVWGAEAVGFFSGEGTIQAGVTTPNSPISIVGNDTDATTSPTTFGFASFAGTMATMNGGLTKSGSGTQELKGPGITFTTPTALAGGKLRLTNVTAWASPITVGDTGAPALQFGAEQGSNWTFTQTISGGSPTAKIEKVGPGTVLLEMPGTSNFTGNPAAAIVVSEGSLYLNSAFATVPNLSVGPGARLGGKVTVGDVTIANLGGIEGGTGGAGVLTVGNLTFAGAGTITAPLSGNGPALVVTGALTGNGGPQSLTAKISGTLPANGTYHFVSFGTFGGTLNQFKFADVVRSLSLALNGNFIDVVVNSENAPVWTGAGGTEWSTRTLPNKNWKLSTNAQPTDFLESDAVTFNDSAVSTAVEVSQTDVAPTSIIFNSSKDYLLGGTRDIVNGGLIKDGSGQLTIQNAFSFSGGAQLMGGTISVNLERALGTGVRTFDGGKLSYTGDSATWTQPSVLTTRGGVLEVGSPIVTLLHAGSLTGPAGATLTKDGPGALRFGAGNIDVNLNLAAGSLILDSTAGPISVNGQITGPGSIDYYGSRGATLGGTEINDFGGDLNLRGGDQLFLNKPAGANAAIGGNINVQNGNWPHHGIVLQGNEQIADTSVLTFNNKDNTLDLQLNGRTETLAGIVTNTRVTGNINDDLFGTVENGGYENGQADRNLPPAKLILSGPDVYNFRGALRDDARVAEPLNNGPLSIAKDGVGTQELVGRVIQYTGTTEVRGGTLRLIDTTTFASSSVTISDPGVLELMRENADWKFNRPVAGNGALRLSGTGMIELPGVLDHTGPTEVLSGTLDLTGSISASAVTVHDGATLLAVGRIGGLLTIEEGAQFSPATAIGGISELGGGLVLKSGSVLDFELRGDDPTPGVGNDLVSITGPLTLDGTLIVTDLGGSSFFTFGAAGTRWRLFEYSGTLTDRGLDLGTLPVLPDGLSFVIDTTTAGQVNLAIVPEPATLGTFLAGLGVILAVRRRRDVPGRDCATAGGGD